MALNTTTHISPSCCCYGEEASFKEQIQLLELKTKHVAIVTVSSKTDPEFESELIETVECLNRFLIICFCSLLVEATVTFLTNRNVIFPSCFSCLSFDWRSSNDIISLCPLLLRWINAANWRISTTITNPNYIH